MTNSTRPLGITLFFSVILIFSHELATAADLTVTLSAAKDRIRVYEALPVTVALGNAGSSPVSYVQDLFTHDPRGFLRIVLPDGSTKIIEHPVLNMLAIERYGVPRVTLDPGEESKIDLLFSCDWGGQKPLFVAEGDHLLSIIYEDGDVQAESNRVLITVLPAPAEERAALEIVRALPRPGILYEPDLVFAFQSIREEETSALEHLANLQSSRLYRNYARLALGKGHVLLASRDTDPKVRAQHIERAQRWLNAIDTDGFTLASAVAAARSKLADLQKGAPPRR